MRDYYKQLFENEMYNLEEMDKLLKKQENNQTTKEHKNEIKQFKRKLTKT